MDIAPLQASSILTRTCGYLSAITSHTLNPYRGCGFGASLCGVGCYVQHNLWITQGRAWGSFVEPKLNAAELYLAEYETERRWARRRFSRFSIFLASSTEPFQPAESKYHITRSILRAMHTCPPDVLIVQTHTHRVMDAADELCSIKPACDLRVHISIETDRESFPGAPNHASPIARRIAAGRALRDKGIFTVATVAPLMPIDDPESFFSRLGEAFDAVLIDHFIDGDGSRNGSRTRRTGLPVILSNINPASLTLDYRDNMVAIARRFCPRVGVGCRGFAGQYLP